MTRVRFEWNQQKRTDNVRKHGVSFEEARTIFLDENATEFFDPDHSQSEDRFVMLGRSVRFRILIVCYCYRRKDSMIRIISARKATVQEEKNYWEMIS